MEDHVKDNIRKTEVKAVKGDMKGNASFFLTAKNPPPLMASTARTRLMKKKPTRKWFLS